MLEQFVKRRVLIAAICTAGASVPGTQLVYAQQSVYPTKAIRLIASQAPGGGIDAVARIVASRLSEAVGQARLSVPA
jgi:tripartite-type tricarboxylate transporter receptor subunit TctC